MRNKFQLLHLILYRTIVWLVFCAFYRLVFLLHYPVKNHFAEGLKAFLIGLRLDASILGYLLIFTLFLGLFRLKITDYFSKLIFTLLLAFHALVSMVDIGLFKQWGHTINFQFFEYMKHPNEAIGSVSTDHILLPIALIIFGFVMAFVFGFKKHPSYQKTESTFALQLMQFIILIPLSVLMSRGGWQLAPVNQSFAFYSNHNAFNFAAINSTWNFMFTLTEKQDDIDLEQFKIVEPLELETIFNQYFEAMGNYPRITKTDNPNVVIVILESFCANAVGFCNNDKGFTPNLDAIAKEGLSYTHAYSSGNRTDKGLAAILSGIPAQANASILTIPDKAKSLPSLTNCFVNNGYSTTFYYGGEPEFANMKAYFVSTGFQKIVSDDDFDKNIKRGKWGVSDTFVYAQLLEDIANIKTPFFKTILTLSSHEPFDYPKNKKEVEGTNFEKSVAYADQCLGNFWKKIKMQPNFKNTLFIFVADHGRAIDNPEKDKFPTISQIPIIFAGGALLDSLSGKKSNLKIHQHHLPSNILNGIGWKEQSKHFLFQSSFTDSIHPIFYTYFNGVGMFKDENCWQFDNVQRKSFNCFGANEDSLVWKARLYQQAVMTYFYNPNTFKN